MLLQYSVIYFQAIFTIFGQSQIKCGTEYRKSKKKMSKFLKHLGLGKHQKGAPHPPKPDYGAQKSTSVQELLPRSPTRDRSTLSLFTGSSQAAEFDTHSLTDSPHRGYYTTDRHEKPGDYKGDKFATVAGTRSKDSGARSLSPKTSIASDKFNTSAADSEEDEAEKPKGKAVRMLHCHSFCYCLW